MQWQEGRNLVSATDGITGISYAYDHNGQRTSKAVDNTIHTYYYASGKLLRETYGSTTLDFFYDASGTPFAIKHAGTVYYYITNLQGDVIRIVNQTGQSVADYEYSPFGEVISATGTLAEINPLRYRGYYYDTESKLYYVSSRYYDPKIGRFINADSFVSTGQGYTGNNMYAYCLNNPVANIDASGAICCSYLIRHNDGGANYITDQTAEPYASMRLGNYTVDYNGCGAVASFNALLSLGDYVPFADILSYFNASSSRTFMNGKYGMLPFQVASCFNDLGYTTALAYTAEEIDSYSTHADASIMFYLFPSSYSVLGMSLPAAHFVQYSRTDQGYIGRNTVQGNGIYEFQSPSSYGYHSTGYYAVGIFIYK